MHEESKDRAPSGIEGLFARLEATYGAAWPRSLGESPIKEIKAAWSANLRGLNADQIWYGVDNLPPRPPNVFEFRDICKAAPMPPTPQLPRPMASQERIAGFVDWKAQMVDALKDNAKQDPKDWARRLQERHKAGEKLTMRQVECYQQALGIKGHQSWQ